MLLAEKAKNEFEGQSDYYFCNPSEILELNLKHGGQKLQGEVIGILKDPVRQEELIGQISFQRIPKESETQSSNSNQSKESTLMKDIYRNYTLSFTAYEK